MVSERIDEYVGEALRHFPRRMRVPARRRLKNLIYQMLEDYTEGEEPTAQDAFAVFDALGDPSEVGQQIFGYYDRERKENVRKAKKLARTVGFVLQVLAILLVVVGIVLLTVDTGASALPIGLAAVFGAITLALRVLYPGLFDEGE